MQHPHQMQRSAARHLGSFLEGDSSQQRAACKVDAEAVSRQIVAACTRLGLRPPANQDNTGRVRAALACDYAPSSSHGQLISAGTHSYCHCQHRSMQPGLRGQGDDSDAQAASRRIAAACSRLGPHPSANQDNTGRVSDALAYYYAPSSGHRQLISAGTHSCCHSQHRST